MPAAAIADARRFAAALMVAVRFAAAEAAALAREAAAIVALLARAAAAELATLNLLSFELTPMRALPKAFLADAPNRLKPLFIEAPKPPNIPPTLISCL